MTITTNELSMIPRNLTYQDAYSRIADYYSEFTESWASMSIVGKKRHIISKGIKASIDCVENTINYVRTLPVDPKEEQIKELASKVVAENLKFSFHDVDSYGIKIGAYAHHILSTLK